MLCFIDETIKNITPHATENGIFTTQISDLSIIRSDCITQELHTLHEPAICIVVQGKKRVMLGQNIFEYDCSKYLSVSFDLPLTGQVVEASKEQPYLCIKLSIDTPLLASLIMDMDNEHIQPMEKVSSSGLQVEQATSTILDPMMRLTALLNHPKDIKILAPSIKRELLYRILSGPSGYHLMAKNLGSGKSKQIANAIAWIKSNFNQPFNAETIAKEAYLSVSTFHKYFKEITLTSPLQFQKHLRLQEARRLMAFEGLDAAKASGIVGYESPSQFNREYKRVFGASPKADIQKLIIEKTPYSASKSLF